MPNNPKYSIIFVAIATLLIGLWAEIFAAAPTIVKIIYATLIYGSVVVLPINNIRNNDFGTFVNVIYILVLIDSLLQIFLTMYNTDPDIYMYGNKWLTLFFNEYTTIALIPPFYAYLATNEKTIPLFVKIIGFFIVGSTILAPIETRSVAFVPLFVIPFFPYVKKEYRFLILIAFIISFLNALTGVRMLMIANIFSVIALVLTFVIRSKIIRILFVIACLAIPFIVFIPILTLENGELSFFQVIMQYLAENNYIEDATDTRTFLYLEMAKDISLNNTWIFGKGSYCHYYSDYFIFNEGSGAIRLYSEVPFLYKLLQGGLVYIFLYFSVLLIAIYKGLILGKNRFIQMSAIIITGWVLNSFIGDLNGCRMPHLGIFFLVGCCLSRRIRNYNDTEIQLVFNDKIESFLKIKVLILLKLLLIRSNKNKSMV